MEIHKLISEFIEDHEMVRDLFSYQANTKKMEIECKSIKLIFKEAFDNFHNISDINKLLPMIEKYIKSCQDLVDEHHNLTEKIHKKTERFDNSVEIPFKIIYHHLSQIQYSIVNKKSLEEIKSLISDIIDM